MEIVFRIGNDKKEKVFETNNYSLGFIKGIKEEGDSYVMTIENNTYVIVKGYAINSFEVYLEKDKMMTLYCGFGNEKKNELTYNVLGDMHSSAYRKGGTWPNFKRFSSKYFLVVFESLHDYPNEQIEKISQMVYLAVQRGIINFDWNGTRSL